MKFKNKNMIVSSVLLILFSLNLSACANKNVAPTPTKITPEKSAPPTVTDLSQRADKIAKQLTTIKGVKAANVVISGDTALVGITLDKTVKGDITNNIKSEVDKKVKAIDSKIKTVAVSADPDIVQRITDIGTGISQGKPMSEFSTEIQELFRRIMPK